jgi:hypothetical protein
MYHHVVSFSLYLHPFVLNLDVVFESADGRDSYIIHSQYWLSEHKITARDLLMSQRKSAPDYICRPEVSGPPAVVWPWTDTKKYHRHSRLRFSWMCGWVSWDEYFHISLRKAGNDNAQINGVINSATLSFPNHHPNMDPWLEIQGKSGELTPETHRDIDTFSTTDDLRSLSLNEDPILKYSEDPPVLVA